MVFAVTGASGYVGSRITERLRSKGHKVYALGRTGSGVTDPLRSSFRLEDPEHVFPKDTQVLIHGAYDFRPHRTVDIQRINGDGSIRVFESALRAGIPHRIFISTISAFDGCASKYGQVKRRVENEVIRTGGIVLRPGLVYGDRMGGMMGTLSALIERTPVVPLIGDGSQMQYLIHVSDLADLAEQLVDSPEGRPDHPVTAAHPEGMTFREVLSALAVSKGRRTRFLPIPWRWIWLVLRTAERAGLRLNMRSDSVVSLMNQNPRPDFSYITRFGPPLKRFQDTLK